MYSLIYKQQSTEMSKCYTQAAAFPLFSRFDWNVAFLSKQYVFR